MAGSLIALTLVGLGAVQALPAAPVTIQERQIWIGDGSGVFVPGIGQPIPPCLADGSASEQAPCLLPVIPGGDIIPGNGGGSIVPGYGGGGEEYPGDDGGEDDLPEDQPVEEEESGVEKRQVWIGDGTGIFIPGQGDFPPCLKDVPLKEQKPCLLGPITTWPKSKRGIQVRQTLIGGGSGTFFPGLTPLPVCVTGVPLKDQPPCFLPPIDGNGGLILTPPKQKRQLLLPPDAATNPKKVIVRLEKELIALQNKKNKTPADIQKIKDLKAALKFLAGIVDIQAPPGTGSSFTPGKRSFKLPPDANTNPKRVIVELEKELINLQNKQHKTEEDLDDIEAIKGALKYLAGIVDIQAPPGTGSSFTPGKRDLFKLPPDAAQNPKKAIEALELTLIGLQNKSHKTKEDIANIKAIKEALKYLAGIIDIQAPPGTGSTFTPGKRGFSLPPDASTNPKKAIETLELTLIHLQNKQYKTKEDWADIKAIKAALKYLAGIIDIQAPPGTGSTFTPGKRGFVLPPDATTNTKQVIEKLEQDLIALQNKWFKSKEDWEDIKAIKAALFYLAGITNISAPPGTGSSFTPGK